MTALGARPLAEAIAYRVFKAYPAIIDHEGFQRTRQLLLSMPLLGGFEQVEPWDVWTWLKSVVNGRRRKQLVRAHHLLVERGQPHAMFQYISSFVKTENLPLIKVSNDVISCDVEYVARLIQAPHDETHLIAGPYLKPLTLALKSHWGYKNWVFYASTTPEKLDAWLRENQHATSYFWSDYSAFDATWSHDAWDMVEGFYAHVFPDAPLSFWEVLQIWRSPRGKMKLRREEVSMWYVAEVCNASGRDDTALANALLNGVALAMSFAAALAGVPVSEVRVQDLAAASHKVRIAIVGDDSLCCCDFEVSEYAERVQANLEGFGLVVKAQQSRNLWDVTFLGSMPYQTSGGLFWGPTIGRRMYKAFWQAEPDGHLPSWTKGVAMQLALCTHVPILSDVAKRVTELLARHSGLVQEGAEFRPYHRTEPTVPWDDTTVEWLCRRYVALSPGMFRRDLCVIGAIERLPAVIHSEVVLACVAADDL